MKLPKIAALRKFSSIVQSQPHLLLPSGQKMPAFGLGTWMTEQVEQAVTEALENNYRHIDTAFGYENEKMIGNVLKKWFSSGKLKRENLFITTKLPMYGVHPNRIEMFMKKSLENLQMKYVNLYLVHFPVGAKYKQGKGLMYGEDGKIELEPKTDHTAVWKKMEGLVDAGHTKNIGLSNYNQSQIEEILASARIKPANLQIELHIYLQQPDLVNYCHSNGISVVAYAPLGSPGFNTFVAKFRQAPVKLPDVLNNPVIQSIATKHSKTPAQVALKYWLQKNVGVIPKSVTPKRIRENINVFDFKLTDSDVKKLQMLDLGEKGRIIDWTVFTGIDEHPDYPFPRKKAKK